MTENPKIPGGYLLIARKMFDGELMDKPPHYLKLWLWLLYKANWKDRDKLKRSQLVATIEEMREAMSYKIGYRVEKPSKDAIRSAYEYFTKAGMITTTKTTRGMVITICNYNIYQNPVNYENRNEDYQKDIMKTATTPHNTEEREKRKKAEEYSGHGSPLSPRILFELWNEIVAGSGMSQVREFGKGREQKSRARLKERSVEEWREVFRLCASTPFLQGENDRGWKADFDWIMKNGDNAAKVLEGKYTNGKEKDIANDRYNMFAGA